jgi:glycosyltransferase involved in cell wall biosynthesis
MKKQGLANIHHLPIFGNNANHLTSPEFRNYFAMEGKWTDVIFTTLPSDRNYLALMYALKDRYKTKLVIDIDDDILSTHTEPNNPAFAAYRNKDARHAEYAEIAIINADLITVSTEYLKSRFEHLNPNIVVVKNCIDNEFFIGDNKPDNITIGYTGAGSHQADWKMIEPILKKMKDKYGVKVKVITPVKTSRDVVDHQDSWVEMMKYPKAMTDLGFSIGIAPLKDSLFNRGKSNLRWLEYSRLGIPTIASDVIPFKGIDNILYATEAKDWEKHLEKLITDEKFRLELGKKASNELKEKYNLNTESKKLFDAISDLV